ASNLRCWQSPQTRNTEPVGTTRRNDQQLVAADSLTRSEYDVVGLDDNTKATGPLAGVVVADFSRVLAGPYATVILADLGATVIKVEGPQGDDTRSWMPPAYEGVASYYQSVNRNKHAITLDFKDAEDLD